MPDRRRFALIATPLLALLAALLANWSVAAAQAPDPLTLTLTAERAECTAGTLNPVAWEISGGTPPYTLTVDGTPVETGAESATVLCATLPEGATEAPATIMAFVTDSGGTTVTASAAYTIVPPLPAPETAGDINVFPDRLVFDWYTAETPAGGDALVAFLVRWREVGSPAWSYESQAPWADKDIGYGVLAELAGLRDPVAYEAAVAPMRHPLEAETPEALRWTPSRQATTVTYPANVTVTSTHDTVTVRWDRQPSATYWEVGLRNTRSGYIARADRTISTADADAWGDPASRTHEVTFRHLYPDTAYLVRVASGTSLPTAPPRNADAVTVRTKAAPVGYTPLPRGPQNLRATSTATTITATWDPPFVGAEQHYELSLFDKSGRRLYIGDVYAPPWTVTLGSPHAGQSYLEPGTTYTLDVVHAGGINPASAVTWIETKPQPDRLMLSLTASRSECTGGTLIPVTWEISGGAWPHRLTVDGTSVDAEEGSATITCAVPPDGASAAPGTVTATVTDASGATATDRAVYTVVPPLPAPTGLQGHALDREIEFYWDWWRPGAPPPMGTWTSACRCQRYLLRWRLAGTDIWTSSLAIVNFGPRGDAGGHVIRGFDEGATYEVAVAKVRDRIEQETPGALLWSAPVQIATFAPPTVEAITTYDTITVNWDPQPGVGLLGVSLSGRKTPHHWHREFTPDGGIPDQVVFRHLPPDTAYSLQVWVDVGYNRRRMTEIDVNTAAAPAEWRPLPRGPQNLRTTVTRNSVTVDWDAPYPGADDVYTVALAGEEAIVSGGVTRHTFTGLAAATPYTVRVTHSDIVSDPVRLAVRTQARAGPLLRLTLSVERAECTEGTFTPVAWTIMGRTAPYSLTVAGEAVAADEGRATVACGALSDDGGLLPATIEAQVTDATGAMASATAGYMIVPPFHGLLFSERAAGVEPLALTLTAVRAECTAGTLNPVVWTITGGTPPDTLTIDGAVVNADAERTMVTCGALPEGASEAPATITGVVTDANGATATARAAYTIVPPLPAPETAGEIDVWSNSLWFRWYTADPPRDADALVAFLVRWREAGSTAWTYRSETPTSNPDIRYGVEPALWGLRDPVAYEAAVAPMRHPLEAETPQALRWTPSLQATTVTYPANVTVSTTHDTVTVRWDRQPSATYWEVGLGNADTSADMRISPSDAAGWGDPASATHEVTFRHLLPDTEYSLSVGFGYVSEWVPVRDVDVTARTKPAPSGYTPLPRGPQNLRATSTATSITVTWEPPFAGAKQNYRVFLFGPDGSRRYDNYISRPPWTFTFISSAVSGGPPNWRLNPDTTYSIRVVHRGIVRAEEEISIATQEWQGAERAPDPLTLTLTVERSECTAGALNSVSWEVRGGVEPYRDLQVDVARVEVDAESTTFTCGALPEGEKAARGTIWASVRDSVGKTATARAAYTIVPPRSAPVCVEYLVGALACTEPLNAP